MPRDVDPPRRPDPLVRREVVEEAGERGGAAGASGESAMQPDRHHLRPSRLAVGVEHVETVAEIGEELVALLARIRDPRRF